MRQEAFRFDAVLELYHTQEDAVLGELSSLESERRGIQKHIDDLFQECQQAREVLSHGGNVDEVQTVARYVEGLRHWIGESRDREDDLQKRIQERMAALKAIRTERMRLNKLKERHRKQISLQAKRLEQKVNDEYAQRKRGR